MIYLERTHCSHPWCEPGINLVYGKLGNAGTKLRRISGCGEPGARGVRTSHRGLPAEMRHALQATVAALIVRGSVPRAEGERFLDEVYAEDVMLLATEREGKPEPRPPAGDTEGERYLRSLEYWR